MLEWIALGAVGTINLTSILLVFYIIGDDSAHRNKRVFVALPLIINFLILVVVVEVALGKLG